ncbi:hypothetical protein CI610_01833 [invertebrate metagenome]|uniref:Uncharacterized protein n=1 Tax=invertebrate metagenome TaxID=1711999 RepID=A0A2H9T7N5_9ZZZZ
MSDTNGIGSKDLSGYSNDKGLSDSTSQNAHPSSGFYKGRKLHKVKPSLPENHLSSASGKKNKSLFDYVVKTFSSMMGGSYFIKSEHSLTLLSKREEVVVPNDTLEDIESGKTPMFWRNNFRQSLPSDLDWGLMEELLNIFEDIGWEIELRNGVPENASDEHIVSETDESLVSLRRLGDELKSRLSDYESTLSMQQQFNRSIDNFIKERENLYSSF